MQPHPHFPNLFVVNHPLVQHKLTEMREKDRIMVGFRGRMREIALLLAYEVTRQLPLTTRRIETPLQPMDAPTLDGPMPAIVPILRAGMVMADAMAEQLIPGAPIGHIGLMRDHTTHRPTEYMVKLPDDMPGRIFIIVDPMLATGGSLAHAVSVVEKHGVAPERIRVMALVAAPEGVQVMLEQHPKVQIYTAALDERLNENAYIVPGLGDAGDRLFGTR
jgi:uracil phosphoribosyltransferase